VSLTNAYNFDGLLKFKHKKLVHNANLGPIYTWRTLTGVKLNNN